MSVADVAARFNLTPHRVYQLSLPKIKKLSPTKRRRSPPIFQRIYTSFGRFEISLASVSAYEAHIDSINRQHADSHQPAHQLNFRHGVTA